LETIALSVDGKKISCRTGSTILEAAEQHGIFIPRLCYHPDLKPHGACRLCLVEDEKTGRLMASCVTPAAADMTLLTKTARLQNHRRNIVRLMLAEHPESCIVCSKGNRCRLRQVAAQLGVGETGLYPMPNYKTFEEANPFIIRDLSKCILCGQCIRADHELVVVGAIDYNMRGFKSRPATAHDLGLEKSNCTFCGTCVSMCPTGALSPKNTRYIGTTERVSESICSFCGVGCSLLLGVSNNKVTEVNPSQRRDTVNRTTLCVRGHFAHDFLNSADRLISPLMRKNGSTGEDDLVPVSWDAAFDYVADRLNTIKNENGPQSIAFIGSSKCTNEENYLFQKIARTLFETNNVDNGGFFYGQPVFHHLDERTDKGTRVNPLSGLEKAQSIIVLGADPNHSVPVVSYYLKRAAVNGTPLIVVDPRKTELVKYSSQWLQIRPRTDLELMNALAALIHKQNRYDSEFIDRYTEGFSIYRYGLSTFDLDRACRMTGLGRDSLNAVADLLHGKKIAFVVGNGVLQQKYGRYVLDAILNLSMLTGSLGSEAAAIYMMAKENNQVGAMDMGAAPDLLPGRHAISDTAIRKTWERAWDVKLSPDKGLTMPRMIEEAEKGNLKALYIMGENPLRSLPQSGRIQKAFENLDFMVVQDILYTSTAKMADVVLPGAAFSEKEGSFTNLEGRIQSFARAARPPGEAKSDWEILNLLAVKISKAKGYDAIAKLKNEIRRLVPAYANLKDSGQGWVKETSRKTLFNSDAADGLISFAPLVSIEDEEHDEAYSYTAILGSCRYHLGGGTRTGSSERIGDFGVAGQIEISGQDGHHLGLEDGDTVRVLSQYGSITRKIKSTKTVAPGQLFIPLAVNANDAINLIGLEALTAPESPGWKTCRVRIEKA
jgi:formate dehydrogenase alpha subunit